MTQRNFTTSFSIVALSIRTFRYKNFLSNSVTKMDKIMFVAFMFFYEIIFKLGKGMNSKGVCKYTRTYSTKYILFWDILFIKTHKRQERDVKLQLTDDKDSCLIWQSSQKDICQRKTLNCLTVWTTWVLQWSY